MSLKVLGCETKACKSILSLVGPCVNVYVCLCGLVFTRWQHQRKIKNQGHRLFTPHERIRNNVQSVGRNKAHVKWPGLRYVLGTLLDILSHLICKKPL